MVVVLKLSLLSQVMFIISDIKFNIISFMYLFTCLFCPLVVSELLWVLISGRLPRMPQGHAVCQYSSKSADLCSGGFEIS